MFDLQKRQRLISVAYVAAIGLIFVAVLASSSRKLTFALASPEPPTERVVIAIEGMHCDGCAAGVKAMLKRTPGVIAVEVSYKEKQAVVDYDSQKTTSQQIVDAISKLGYRASVKNKS